MAKEPTKATDLKIEDVPATVKVEDMTVEKPAIAAPNAAIKGAKSVVNNVHGMLTVEDR